MELNVLLSNHWSVASAKPADVVSFRGILRYYALVLSRYKAFDEIGLRLLRGKHEPRLISGPSSLGSRRSRRGNCCHSRLLRATRCGDEVCVILSRKLANGTNKLLLNRLLVVIEEVKLHRRLYFPFHFDKNSVI